jgi:hypothetical protein
MANMIEYINSIITNFPEEITVVWTSLSVDHLFIVREELLAKPLLEEQARAFHHATAQLLFLSVGRDANTVRDVFGRSLVNTPSLHLKSLA